MKLLGIIGYPLQHSFSKRFFDGKFQELQLDDHEFRLFPIQDVDIFPELISQHPQLSGLAVTIPHKVNVMRFLDEIDPAAMDAGAINCIHIKNGHLKGYNTDAIGFEHSIAPHLRQDHTRALILGTGGASLAARYVFRKLGIPFQMVSRSKDKDSSYLTYSELTEEVLSAHQIIVNCTPLGTFPDIHQKPEIPYQWITPKHLLFDMVYNPELTAFMQGGLEQGAMVLNGMQMLLIQAEENWRIWNDG